MVVKSMENSLDFDIGQFLNSYDALKDQISDLREVMQAIDVLRRWDVPSVSFLFCVFVVTLCISFPDFLFAFCLCPIPLILFVTYIKTLGQKPSKHLRNIVVVAVENEEQSLKRKQEMIERSRKDLRRFVKVLCDIQGYIDMINGKVYFIQSLLLWKDPPLTSRFLGCIFVMMFLFSFVPLSLILLMSFLYIFFNNPEFRKVVAKKLYIEIPRMRSKIFNEKDYNTEEWYDACTDIESDLNSSSDERSSGEDSIEENNASQNAEKQSKSFMLNISEYRKRRKEFKKGNCAACDVAFSSLLTRRRYCRRCGDKFCSKCCRHYVKKAALGATAPGSRDKRVLVCNNCYGKLRVTKAPD